MATVSFKTELGRDSDVKLAFFLDGQPIRHNELTRVQFYVGNTLIDSFVQPSLFDFTQAGSLTVKLGQAGLTKGHYPVKAYIFDSTHTLGMPWDDDLMVIDVI